MTEKQRTLQEMLHDLSQLVAPPVFILLKLNPDGFAELHGISKTLDGLTLLNEKSDDDTPNYVG